MIARLGRLEAEVAALTKTLAEQAAAINWFENIVYSELGLRINYQHKSAHLTVQGRIENLESAVWPADETIAIDGRRVADMRNTKGRDAVRLYTEYDARVTSAEYERDRLASADKKN